MNNEKIEKLAKEIRIQPDVINKDRILADANRIGVKHLPIRISEGGVLPVPESEGSGTGEIRFPPGGMSLYHVEKELIRKALEQAKSNKTTAARLLRITRDTLRYKVKKYGLE